MMDNRSINNEGCGEITVTYSPTPIATTIKLTVEICEVRVNRPFVLIIQLWNSEQEPAGRFIFERMIESEKECCETFCETFCLPVIRKPCCVDEICGSALVHYIY